MVAPTLPGMKRRSLGRKLGTRLGRILAYNQQTAQNTRRLTPIAQNIDMRYLINAIVSLVIASGVMLFALNAPANWFHIGQVRQLFGSSFTTLVGTNQLSAFPTTYNANLGITANTSAANTFNGLETDAAGFVSQSSSTVVGNFTTSGSLTLGNELTVPNGGTSSTTLSQYAVLIGNATGDLLTPTNDLGTNGQFLTSGGAGVAPSWTTSAINQASNYTWTGLHTFNTEGIIDNASSTFPSGSTLNINGTLNFNGTNIPTIAQIANKQTFTTSGTWTMPTGAKEIFVQLWGGGGSGGVNSNISSAGGGGGGQYWEQWFSASQLSSSEIVTIGAGGLGVTNPSLGNPGGTTSFAGMASSTGGGAGQENNSNPVSGGNGGAPQFVGQVAGFWGVPVTAAAGGYGLYSAAGGGSGSSAGGNSLYGGGGGGGCPTGTGGTSYYGGAGGAGANSTTATAGTQPGGGGGASCSGTSGSGGAGEVIVTTFF